MIVGTSTNCSTINGSDRAAHEGQDDDEEIMGTSITCSATGKSRATEELQHAVHHLRHGSIEDLHGWQVIDELLPRVPRPLHLPASDLRQRCWPALRGWRLLSPWRVVRLALHPLSATAVMPGRSNSHAHGQTFVLPVAPETSFTSPLCGAESTASIARNTIHVTS